MNNDPPVINILLLGDTGVGKSSYAYHVREGVFPPTIHPTIGCDYVGLEVQGARVRLWDFAGSERYKAFLQYYASKIDVLLLFFDLSSERGFETIVSWTEACLMARNKSTSPMRCVVVGNKRDSGQAMAAPALAIAYEAFRMRYADDFETIKLECVSVRDDTQEELRACLPVVPPPHRQRNAVGSTVAATVEPTEDLERVTPCNMLPRCTVS